MQQRKGNGFLRYDGPTTARPTVGHGACAGAVGEARTLPDLDLARRPVVTYVVVAYRSARDLAACLDAIEADRPAGAQLVVVDNASPDASADIARAHTSRPSLIASSSNLGFGGACNLAIEASDGDLLFFVNPDARLAPGTTGGLVEAIQADSSVAAAGPRIVDSAASLHAASAGHEPSIRTLLGHFLLLARIPLIGRSFPPFQLPQGSPAQAVDWVGGAALMVRRDAFLGVGGFDPAMFLYMEDVDLCRRLREQGWRIAYAPAVVVTHDLGGSQGSEQAERWIQAFHAYLRRRQGGRRARIGMATTAIGLAARALLSARVPSKRRRMARAARAAIRLALSGDRATPALSEA